ncbi:MAG: RrF2 family transcriptional regulator [Sedimentisphaerales bacterium]
MRISKKCQYALRAVFELASRDSGQPMKISEIAGAQNIPPRFLEIILNELRHAGLLNSQRGRQGGYLLARRAEELTVGEVIEHIQGRIYMTAESAEKPNESQSYFGDYAFKELWQKVDNAVSEVCDNMTFAELVEYEKAKKYRIVPNYTI